MTDGVLTEVDEPPAKTLAASRVLTVLGYGDGKHHIRYVSGTFKGITIVDDAGRPVRFFSAKRLRKMRHSPVVAQVYGAMGGPA